MKEIFKINGIDYEAEFTLSNADNQKISFTKSAIRAMTLVDNIFDPFMSGSISIANPYDFIENEYFFRGDGRDEIHISFKQSGDDVKDEEKVDQTFVVLDESSTINPVVRSENIKTLYIIDKKALAFSDLIPYGKIYTGKVGDILKTIFTEVLGEDSVDEDNWESGDFQLTYTPPATYRYIDLLRTMLHLFYIKDDEIYTKGFISWDRTKEKFRMDLLSKIFKDNEKNTIEAFGLGDLTSDMKTANPNNPISKALVGEYIGQLKNLGYSTPFYGWNTDYFVNCLVYGYDHVFGTFKMRKIDFEDIKKKWQKNFVDVFKSTGGKPKPFCVINETTSKKIRRFSFPYNVEDSAKLVEADIYNCLTFYNLQSSFSNIGRTNRKSGKFLDIYTTRNDDTYKSDEKLLGRWYITEVRHVFNGDSYTNEIFCTKTYCGPETKLKEDAK